jgi:hypothetical protein
MISQDRAQDNILSAVDSHPMFLSECKPFVDLLDHVFTEFPQSFRVLALG